MLQVETSETWGSQRARSRDCEDEVLGDGVPDDEDILGMALEYLHMGSPRKADELLTVAVMENPSDHRLWMAAGISRMRRGKIPQAACAFRMASWLTGDPEAVELLQLCDEVVV